MSIIWFKDCSYEIKEKVGGKNASLGELYKLSKNLNFKIANGFSITTELYDNFIELNNLNENIEKTIDDVNVDDIEDLNNKSEYIKSIFDDAKLSEDQIKEILENFHILKGFYTEDIQVAVRSSAIAEDLPNASFAGQQDTYLNITSDQDLLKAVKDCFASLFNSRAISYRKTNNIKFNDVKISVGIQKMVRSDIGSAGVCFSIDPESGYNKAIVINSSFGLGELVVSGGVKPDEFIVDKRVLNDIKCDPIIMKSLGNKNSKIIYSSEGVSEIETNLIEKSNFSLSNNHAAELARCVLLLEESYCKLFNKNLGVDVEWALDGIDKEIYIIQTRPETIHSNNEISVMKKYIVKDAEKNNVLLKGVSVGEKVSDGKIKVLKDMSEFREFNEGEILVTSMTTPDWEPIMKKSAGIITDKGGRTCHAAIVARELGINAIVGTSNASKILKTDQNVTMSCAEGEVGKVYEGKIDYGVESYEIDLSKKLPVNLMLNVGSPENAFSASLLPNCGVGLARLEFIINNYVEIHPLALLDYPNVREDVRIKIKEVIGEHDDGKWYFIKRLARGMAKIASAFYPNNVIVRLSDFKSNEYKNLIGGELYEPNEENPMLGWRGASRYYSDEYKKGFELECLAIKYARENMKMDNIVVMIPFCRTPEECKNVLSTMKDYGLERGVNNLQVYLMCEIPSNVIEADNFSKYIDGVSIGGNDLLQLTLGIDRDSEKITNLSDHTNISYRRMISNGIKTYKSHNIKVGFCGQQPSDSIEFCKFLINEGIDSISVTADSALKTFLNLSDMN
jgi:pyruvate,water dikinase